jgi:hypothetical protein
MNLLSQWKGKKPKRKTEESVSMESLNEISKKHNAIAQDALDRILDTPSASEERKRILRKRLGKYAPE